MPEALQHLFEGLLSDVNTALPGEVVSWDGRRAVVKPSQAKRLADGRVLAAPTIVEVPVVWAGGGGARMTFPLAAGDKVLLVFAQRALEGWLGGRTGEGEDDPRRFDLSDAIAVPGLDPRGAAADLNDVVVEHGAAEFRLKKDGNAVLHANLKVVGNIDVEGGSVTADGDVQAGTVSLRTHRHLASGGQGIGGTPQP